MKDLYKAIEDVKKNPYLVFFIGFATIILIGAILLALPTASINGNSVGFVNALFTSASATCVTGLVVVSTTEYSTVFGNIVIDSSWRIGGYDHDCHDIILFWKENFIENKSSHYGGKKCRRTAGSCSSH